MKTKESIIKALSIKASHLEKLQEDLRGGTIKQSERITLGREKTKSKCEALLYVIGTDDYNVYECEQGLIERLKILGIAHESAKGNTMKEQRFVTFGQDHRHVINGVVFDHNCVAIVDGDRATVFELFGPKFCFEYKPENWNPEHTSLYPRGFIIVDTSIDN